MTTAFLVFLAVYVAYALYENLVLRRTAEQRLTLLSAFLQGPLFVSALYFAVMAGVINRDLVFIPYILVGLAVGHVLFIASLLVTDRHLGKAWRQFLLLRDVFRFLADDPNTLFRVFVTSFSEEVIYRAAAQPLLSAATGSAVAGILIAAAAFCVVHDHFFRNPWPQSLEFAIFALLLGGLYFSTGNLVLVTLIHAVRNWEICFLEHLLDQQEEGGAAPAPAHGEALPGTP